MRDPSIATQASDEACRAAQSASAPQADERPWIGADMPSLEANADDSFEIDVPGYDLRRLVQARDPLAAALAFSVQVLQHLTGKLLLCWCVVE